MATKRMFDKAIIDMDKFMDLSMSAKALYFLLGMEADDEGFVSYKKVMRVHGGNEDDIKILIGKEFVIHFPSGVVVITDWNKNNYLDKNRMKPTEYQKEKKILLLTNDNKYELNNGLTSIEESSIEENRGEEETPAQESIKFFSGDWEDILQEFIKSSNLPEQKLRNEFSKFILYWTEKNKSGSKQRWQLEKTFEVRRRLVTWLSRIKEFSNTTSTKNNPNYVL